jgi:hypothetical protein
MRVVDKEICASPTTIRVKLEVPTRPLLVEVNGVNPDLFMLKVQLALEIALQSVFDGKDIWVVEKERNTNPMKRSAPSLILEE